MSCDHSSLSCDHQEQHDEVEFLEAMMVDPGEFEWREVTEGGGESERRVISGTLNISTHLEAPLLVELARKVGRKASHKDTPSQHCPPPGFSSIAQTGFTGNETSMSNVQEQAAKLPSSRIQKHSGAEKKHSSGKTAIGPDPTGAKLVTSGASNCSQQPQMTTAEVLHLPPISLHFQLPPKYPSEKKPDFTLSCKWLNFTQLSLLCHHLDHLWDQDPGTIVLYKWQQFLASETLLYLGISSNFLLVVQNPTYPHPSWDPRAIQDIGHPLYAVPSLVEYDKAERERVFSDSFFDCEICFLTLQGSKCIQMAPCDHIHCRDCLTGHIISKIGQGDVTKIDCPSVDCEHHLPPNIVKQLVSPEAFERYDKLLLQRTLDGMQDVVYCPRPSCRCVTVKEDDSNMAICPRCRFSFCVLCSRSWHGVSPCRLLPEDISELRETWEALDEESRKALEVQYGKDKLYRSFQEVDSHKWIESNAKLCPRCKSKIQKVHGCNKMTCSQCGSHFCWLCDAPLSGPNPYAHFRLGNTSCAGKLFEGLEDVDEDDFFF